MDTRSGPITSRIADRRSSPELSGSPAARCSGNGVWFHISLLTPNSVGWLAVPSNGVAPLLEVPGIRGAGLNRVKQSEDAPVGHTGEPIPELRGQAGRRQARESPTGSDCGLIDSQRAATSSGGVPGSSQNCSVPAELCVVGQGDAGLLVAGIAGVEIVQRASDGSCSARLAGERGRGPHRDGHQFAGPTSTAMAGTVMVRTRKVSSKSPIPMTKPAWTMVVMLANSRPNIVAAKIRPAEVITPPVEPTVRLTPERMPRGDSSRIREMSSML